MLVGVEAYVHMGYGYEHLISQDDMTEATNAVAGVEFRRASDALKAAEDAFRDSVDTRAGYARISVILRGAYGDIIEVG